MPNGEKFYDVRLEALCYTLDQVYVNHMTLISVFGDTDEDYFMQLKALVGEIEFRLQELLECYTPHEYLQMHDNAKLTFYNPDLVENIRVARDLEDLKLRQDISDCRKTLWRCADNPGKDIDIRVGDKEFRFYDHAALIQGLSDALDYFESEL